MYNIYVPTYNKKVLPVLDLLEDDNIEITLCVRHECLDQYSDLDAHPRIHILDLGSDIHDIGETRKRLLQYSYDVDDKFCIMFDDSVSDIYENGIVLEANHVSFTIRNAINDMKCLPLHDRIFMYNFWKLGSDYLGTNSNNVYFKGLPIQAVIINNIVAKEHGLMYKSMNECGLEDAAFFLDGVKQGLITIGGTGRMKCKKSNHLELGGNHDTLDAEAFEAQRDADCQKLLDYTGLKYGYSLEKKYRASVPGFLTYVRIDFGYLRDILVYDQDHNEKILKEMFK